MERNFLILKIAVFLASLIFMGISMYPLFKNFPGAIFILLLMVAIFLLNILKSIIEENKYEQQKWMLRKEKARLEAERKADYESKKAERQAQYLQQKEELLRIKKELRLERAKLFQERNTFRRFPNSDYYDNQYW